MTTKKDAMRQLIAMFEDFVVKEKLVERKKLLEEKKKNDVTIEKVVAAIERFAIPPYKADQLLPYLRAEAEKSRLVWVEAKDVKITERHILFAAKCIAKAIRIIEA